MDPSDSTPDKPKHPLRGLLVATLLPLAVFVATVSAFELPLVRTGTVRAGEGRAAIAVRDHVHPVEKLGTWAMVEPRLNRAYAEVRTVTQRRRGSSDDSAERFGTELAELVEQYDVVDVFLMSHTNYYVRAAQELEVAPEALGLVYNSGCKCGAQSEEWLELGADAYVAHPKIASHAMFFVQFLEHWLRGVELEAAVAQANDRADGFFAATAALWPRAREKWLGSHGAISGRSDLVLEAVE